MNLQVLSIIPQKTDVDQIHGKDTNKKQCSITVEAEPEEFMETFSDIDYDLHVRQSKEAAAMFKKLASKHDFRILKPISENENLVCHFYHKCLFQRCRQDL